MNVTASDREYIQSLDTRYISGREALAPLRYIVNGDLSSMVPQTEHDFLLLVPTVPPQVLPSWPLIITDLDGVYLTRSDEFIEVVTTDAAVLELIASLQKVDAAMIERNYRGPTN